jgi:hypothetical protein
MRRQQQLLQPLLCLGIQGSWCVALPLRIGHPRLGFQPLDGQAIGHVIA